MRLLTKEKRPRLLPMIIFAGACFVVSYHVSSAPFLLTCHVDGDWSRCLKHARHQLGKMVVFHPLDNVMVNTSSSSSSNLVHVSNNGTDSTLGNSHETIRRKTMLAQPTMEPSMAHSMVVVVATTTAPTSTSTIPMPVATVVAKRWTQFAECPLSKKGAFTATNMSYSADQDIVLPLSQQLDRVEMALCYLDQDNTQRFWLHHFPHSLQTTLQCWSFFQRVKERFPNAKHGFWINNDGINGRPKLFLDKGSWTPSLLRQTQSCSYHRDMNRTVFQENQTLGILEQDKALVHRLPNSVKLEWRTPQWFSRPEDALSLQQVVLGQSAPWDGAAVTTGHLTIGLLQRTNSRRITNLDDIQQALRQRYPNATIEQTIMDGKDFYQQAEWWSQQHVVVAAHGAALSNIIFMSQQAGIVEIFPQDFYELKYFKRLSHSMGIRLHQQWINASVTDPEALYQKRSKQNSHLIDVTPPIKEIVHHVDMIVNNMTLRAALSS